MSGCLCPRCGKISMVELLTLPIWGTAYGAPVCEQCYGYLMENENAYARYVILVRAEQRRAR